MNNHPNLLLPTCATNTHAVDSRNQQDQNLYQLTPGYATTPQWGMVPSQLPPVEYPTQTPPTQAPQFVPQFAPTFMQQPQFVPVPVPMVPNQLAQPQQPLFPFPATQFPGIYGMNPTPIVFPHIVPANMQVYEALNGQVYPVMKGEESAVSNASSESGLAMDTSSQSSTQNTWEKPPTPKRSPPGFENKPLSPQPLKKKPEPKPKPSPTLNYARAVRTKATPPPPKREKIRAKREASSEVSKPVTRRSHKDSSTTTRSNRRPKKKFAFRSKQNMIDKVYDALCQKYEEQGVLAGKDEVLRGDDTIRLHVKKFKALQRIEEALEAVERQGSIEIIRVSIPLSMKNQFQKKGFLVYTKIATADQVRRAQSIFRTFEEFKKCEVARQSSDTTTPVVRSVATKSETGEPNHFETSFARTNAESDGLDEYSRVEEWTQVEGYAEPASSPVPSSPEYGHVSPELLFEEGVGSKLDDELTLMAVPMVPSISASGL